MKKTIPIFYLLREDSCADIIQLNRCFQPLSTFFSCKVLVMIMKQMLIQERKMPTGHELRQ